MIACLAALGRVFDVALARPPTGVYAPPPPEPMGERDAELAVVARAGADRRPVAGAAVRVFHERGGRYYDAGSARTDASGRALLRGLPRGAAWVIVDADGFARVSITLVLSGDARAAEVSLEPAVALAVEVRDEEQRPLAGATVLVSAADPLPFGALTGNDGRVRFTRLGAGPWAVKVSARGYESVTRAGITADTTVELRRLGMLEVRVVTAGGAPVAFADVVITGPALWPARRATTDQRGVALISALLAGSYDLKAEKGELVSDTLLGVPLARGQHQSVTLEVRPGRMVTVVVTDGDGDSPLVVPGADVVLAESGLSSFPRRGRTGADGSLVLGPLAPGPATLAARADDFVPRGGVPVPDVLDGPVRVALLRGGVIEGEVVDSKGVPVDGASIEIIGTDRSGLPVSETPMMMAFRREHFEWALPGPLPLIPAGELGVMPGPVPPIPGALPASDAPEAESPASPRVELAPWVTRFDGTFTAKPVTPGRVRALVRHPSYVEATSDAVSLAPGGHAKVRVVLLSGGALEGTVVDERDRPVEGARVELSAVEGTLERSTLTASDGSFAFAAVPAEITLSVARPEEPTRAVIRRALEVSEGQRATVRLALPPLRGAVKVVVTSEEREPVDAAQVTLLSLDPDSPFRQTQFTTADGTQSFDDAAGLPLRVVVEAPGWARIALTTERADETIELALKHGVLVEGRVTGVRGRELLSGASVTLVADGLRKSALTDAEGRYVLRDVTPGPARLIVSHLDHATAETTVRIEATGRADRAFELPDVDLAEPATVEGEVLDGAGKPVTGARVAVGVVPAYLPAGALPPGLAVTDASGRFKLTDVAPGALTIEAYAVDVGRGEARAVQVDAGHAVTGLVIRLAPTGADDEPASSGGVAVTLGERGEGTSLEVVIVQVAEGSEAERAGLREGDVILRIDGAQPEDMRDARRRLAGPLGADVLLELERDEVTLRERVNREPVRR